MTLGGKHVVICAPDIPVIEDADAVVSLAWGTEADVLVVPAPRMDPTFFELRSGLAGAVMQKCANYHVHLVVLGDVSSWTDRSRAFRDFVYEANKGSVLWFVSEEAEVEGRLGG